MSTAKKESKKNEKKVPLKNLKEKRAAKAAKRDGKNRLFIMPE